MSLATRSVHFLGAWFLVCLSLQPALAYARSVATNERDAVVVIELDKHAIEKYRWFYRRIEDFSADVATKRLGPFYHSVKILYRDQATLAELARTLSALAARPENRAIDLFLQVHGIPDQIVFWEGPQSMKKIADTLLADANLASKLRAVSSSACFGKSHADGWLSAGFDVVNGAREVNANGLFDFPQFIKQWTGGKTFVDAQTAGNAPKPMKFYDDIARGLGFAPVDSYKEIFGRETLTIGVIAP